MNFFAAQDQARAKTGRLLFLFGCAIAGTIGAVYAGIVVILGALGLGFSLENHYDEDYGSVGTVLTIGARKALPFYEDPLFYGVTAITLAIILIGALLKTLRIREGGASVARMLGGRELESSTREPDERKLLNVVEEMALASGCPVPSVFVLDQESGINAFAAGFSPSEASITVSKGALTRLNRDELQGVVAHEFSHIFNGDMRLNMRLMGLLAGLLLLGKLGQGILRNLPRRHSSRARNNGGPIVVLAVLGTILLVVGFVGVLFGRLIKAAVSRSREFLADASAVQFTRNPKGIAGALLKIRDEGDNGRILATNAEDFSHFFFAEVASRFTSFFATHPPLEERLRAIHPALLATGARPSPQPVPESTDELALLNPETLSAFNAASPLVRTTVGEAVASIGNPRPDHLRFAQSLLAELSPGLIEAIHTAEGARGILYAIFLEPQASPARSVLERQLAALQKSGETKAAARAVSAQAELARIGERARMPLIDLALPALRHLSSETKQVFLANIDALVRADGKIALPEYALRSVLYRQLSRKEHERAVVYRKLGPVLEDCVRVLSLLAYAGHRSPAESQTPFKRGLAQLTAQPLAIAAVAECSPEKLDTSLARLRGLAPLLKERVVSALTHCALADGQITVREAETLRALTEAMGCPMPPLLNA